MRGPDVVFYHFPCVDGFTAKYVVEKYTEQCTNSSEVQFVPFDNKGMPQPIKDLLDKHIVFVDCAPGIVDLTDLMQIAKSVTILDHHSGNIVVFVAMGLLDYNTQINTPVEPPDFTDVRGLRFYLSENNAKSGARLALDFFQPSIFSRLNASNIGLEKLVDIVSDRDTWRFKGPYTAELHEYITSFNYSTENWDRLVVFFSEESNFLKALESGRAILRKKKHDIQELLKSNHRVTLILEKHSITVIVECNMPYAMISDAAAYAYAIAEKFIKDEPTLNATLDNYPINYIFAAYNVEKTGDVKWSLRSEQVNVAKIAQFFGGNGHKAASGFRTTLQQLTNGLAWSQVLKELQIS